VALSVVPLVGYSAAMTTTTRPPKTAPEISPGYPYKRRLFPAWQEAWSIMRSKPRTFVDGRELAERSAEASDVYATTMVGVLSRAANAGLLEREYRDVRGESGKLRKRTFYRIARSDD
jgi:hypothetical protein